MHAPPPQPDQAMTSTLTRSCGRTLALLLALLGATAAVAQQTLVAGPQGTPMELTQALQQARDGDTIELLPGEYLGRLVIENRRLTLRGVAGGKPAVIQGEGKMREAKALWIVRGGEVTLENLEFRGARANDGGAAGVRQEGGKLSIRHCSFFDNEHGLLAANDSAAELRIESSVFGMAPKVVGGLYHLINIGRIGKFSVTGTRFQQGFEGHLMKLRARESFIGYNFIHDGTRGGASYEIDLAAGGMATVIGNVIGQGADTQNPVVLAYATDGQPWERNALYVAHNTFVNHGWMPAWFLRVFKDHLPADTDIQVINNLVVGPGVFWLGAPGHFEGNRQALASMLRDIDTYAFELAPGSVWRGSGVDPRRVAGRDLAPQAEFEWPVGTRALKDEGERWTPGAYQR